MLGVGRNAAATSSLHLIMASLVLIATLNIMVGRETFSLKTLIGISLVFLGLAVLALR